MQCLNLHSATHTCPGSHLRLGAAQPVKAFTHSCFNHGLAVQRVLISWPMLSGDPTAFETLVMLYSAPHPAPKTNTALSSFHGSRLAPGCKGLLRRLLCPHRRSHAASVTQTRPQAIRQKALWVVRHHQAQV